MISEDIINDIEVNKYTLTLVVVDDYEDFKDTALKSGWSIKHDSIEGARLARNGMDIVLINLTRKKAVCGGQLVLGLRRS